MRTRATPLGRRLIWPAVESLAASSLDGAVTFCGRAHPPTRGRVAGELVRPWDGQNQLLLVQLADLFAEPVGPERVRCNDEADRTAAVVWFRRAYERLILAGFTIGDPIPLAAIDNRRFKGTYWCGRTLYDHHHHWPAREADAWLGEVAVGSRFPRLVIIGIAPNATSGGWPFFSQSGLYLLLALRHLGYDEAGDLLVTNADIGHNELVKFPAIIGTNGITTPLYVALGDDASGQAARAGLAPLIRAQHPSWHKRFRSSESYAGYARTLVALGVPDLAHTRGPLPAVPVDPAASVSLFGDAPPLGRTIAYIAGFVAPAVNAEYVQRARARKLYCVDRLGRDVVAARVGLSIDRVVLWIRKYGWAAERRRLHVQLDRDGLAAAAVGRSAALRAVWSGLAAVARRLRERVERGDFKQDDAEAFVRAAYAVATLSDQSTVRQVAAAAGELNALAARIEARAEAGEVTP